MERAKDVGVEGSLKEFSHVERMTEGDEREQREGGREQVKI